MLSIATARRPSVCDIEVSWLHRLEYYRSTVLETPPKFLTGIKVNYSYKLHFLTNFSQGNHAVL